MAQRLHSFSWQTPPHTKAGQHHEAQGRPRIDRPRRVVQPPRWANGGRDLRHEPESTRRKEHPMTMTRGLIHSCKWRLTSEIGVTAGLVLLLAPPLGIRRGAAGRRRRPSPMPRRRIHHRRVGGHRRSTGRHGSGVRGPVPRDGHHHHGRRAGQGEGAQWRRARRSRGAPARVRPRRRAGGYRRGLHRSQPLSRTWCSSTPSKATVRDNLLTAAVDGIVARRSSGNLIEANTNAPPNGRGIHVTAGADHNIVRHNLSSGTVSASSSFLRVPARSW